MYKVRTSWEDTRRSEMVVLVVWSLGEKVSWKSSKSAWSSGYRRRGMGNRIGKEQKKLNLISKFSYKPPKPLHNTSPYPSSNYATSPQKHSQNPSQGWHIRPRAPKWCPQGVPKTSQMIPRIMKKSTTRVPY